MATFTKKALVYWIQFIESVNPIYGIGLNLPDCFSNKTFISIPLLRCAWLHLQYKMKTAPS